MSYEEEINEESICLNEEKEIDSCLVVCFEEHETNDDGIDSIDTRLFVTYDHATSAYVVNGKRQDIFSKKGRNKTNLKPFVFCASESDDIVDFIMLSFSGSNSLSYIMYNYNNLPEDACEMTYEFMETNMDRRYEIAAFDNVDIRRNNIRRLVRLTKNMYN
jgi:hypothetical protein